jgi:hypothetical protein
LKLKRSDSRIGLKQKFMSTHLYNLVRVRGTVRL